MDEEQEIEKNIESSRQNKGIEDTILNAEKVSLSGRDILRLTKNDTKLLPYEDLERYDSLDQLIPFEGDSLTLLYQTTEDYGHWVVLINRGSNKLEFYDPYGLKPDEELKQSDFHLRQHGGEIQPHLTALLDKGGYEVVYNDKRLQRFLKDINTCGRYTALRVKFKHLSIPQFNSLFLKNKCYNADFWVSALTLFL
jgi:hypothetical protein